MLTALSRKTSTVASKVGPPVAASVPTRSRAYSAPSANLFQATPTATPVTIHLPPLIPHSVQPKEIVMAYSELTQKPGTRECNIVAAQQLTNYTSEQGLVGREHGQALLLQNKDNNIYKPEILAMNFEIDHHEARKLVSNFTKYYGFPEQYVFSLNGKTIQLVIELARQLQADGLPQFQILASGNKHAYAIHAMGSNKKLLTTGVPSGEGTYFPTQYYDSSIIIGSRPLELQRYKPYQLDLSPSYGFVPFKSILDAISKDKRNWKTLRKIYELLMPGFEEELEKMKASKFKTFDSKYRL
jgi:hypothetical protein